MLKYFKLFYTKAKCGREYFKIMSVTINAQELPNKYG